MSNQLMDTRREKHHQFNGAQFPLASTNRISIQAVLSQLAARDKAYFDQPENIYKTSIAGRLVSFRRNGGIAFLSLRDSTGTIQLIFTKNNTERFTDVNLLDIGDIIEISGNLKYSSTNEPSVLVNHYNLLTKSYRPLPEKWLGLSDPEMRARKRYLDLISNQQSRARFIVRSYIVKLAREFLVNRDFLEVETSTLNTVSSGANAKPFITHHNTLDTDLYLRVAPELYLKRLVVGGFDKVFEIGRCYRNEGMSSRHNPEFTMLEYYQAYANFNTLISQTKDFLTFIDQRLPNVLPPEVSAIYQQWKSERNFLLTNDSFITLPMRSAVISALEKSGFTCADHFGHIIPIVDRQDQRHQELRKQLHTINTELNTLNYGMRLMFLFETFAEPYLTVDYIQEGKSAPVIITHYPVETSPLARPNDQDPRYCDRFELFVNGRELCNAYQEINNPDEQLKKFQAQLEDNKKDPMDCDLDYIEALEVGMPPCVGFGIGLDRAAMLLTNAQSIKEVILFPTVRRFPVDECLDNS